MNEKVKRLAEAIYLGKLAEAGDLLEEEMDRRREEVSEEIKNQTVKNILGESALGVTKNVKGLGRVSITPSSATLEVGSLDEAKKSAGRFCDWLDNTSGYKVSGVQKTGDNFSLEMKKGGSTEYDVIFNEADKTLTFSGDFSSADISYFRSKGELPPL